jgi:hypothetical protein
MPHVIDLDVGFILSDTVDDSIPPDSVGPITIELTDKFGADRRLR